MKTFNDLLSKGAANDGTQSSDRLGNFFREACEYKKRYEARNDPSCCPTSGCMPYDWDADDRYYKASREFNKNGERGASTYDFTKGK